MSGHRPRGESFTALAENLQNALWGLGGVPAEHRTDSLSAAYRNLGPDEALDVTRRYEAFCGHYGLIASRNNPGPLLEVRAHENGAVESHHGHLETALDQALILRGSPDFATVDVWGRPGTMGGTPHPAAVTTGASSTSSSAAATGVARIELSPRWRHYAPCRHGGPPTSHRAGPWGPRTPQRARRPGHPNRRVPRSSGLLQRACPVDRPPLPNWRLRVHLYDDRIEAWLGATRVLSHPRKRGRKDGRRLHVVDYRHVIQALRRKPQALAGSIYRDELFPGTAYAPRIRAGARRRLSSALPQKEACRRMVALLALAHDEACETELGKLIDPGSANRTAATSPPADLVVGAGQHG